MLKATCFCGVCKLCRQRKCMQSKRSQDAIELKSQFKHADILTVYILDCSRINILKFSSKVGDEIYDGVRAKTKSAAV